MPTTKLNPNKGGRKPTRAPKVSKAAVQQALEGAFMGKKPTPKEQETLDALATKPEALHGLRKGPYHRLLQAAEAIHGESDQQLLYMAQALILCGLPYKPLKDDQGNPVTHYERTVKTAQGRLTLTVATADKNTLLPYGKDRLALAWLQTKALRQDDPTVKWETATEFFDLFGLSRSGREYIAFRETWKRLGSAIFSIRYEDQGSTQGKLIPILEEWSLPTREDANGEKTGKVRLPGIPYYVTLSPTLWRHLKQVPVPQRLEILRVFADEPKAWDFVSFVCWRAKACEAAAVNGGNPIARIPWKDLVEQLGTVDKNPRRLRATLRSILGRLKVIWPECKADFLDGGTLVIEQPLNAIHPVKER